MWNIAANAVPKWVVAEKKILTNLSESGFTEAPQRVIEI